MFLHTSYRSRVIYVGLRLPSASVTSRRYISSNGTSSWTKYDRGERLPKYADVHIGGSVSPAYRIILFGNNPLVIFA
jgi:hypothetical protein